MTIDWSDERPSIDLVKQTVTLPEVAELLGLEPDRNGKIRSPFNPDENTPSCHLYEDHFYDFSTGRGGDVVDLVQLLTRDEETGEQMPFGKAVWMIWNRALRAGKEPGDVEAVAPRNLVDFGEEFYGMTFEPGSYWPELLGCPLPATVRMEDDGTKLLIAHQDEDGVYGVKIRELNGAKMSWPGSQFTKRLYHPHGWPEWHNGRAAWPGNVAIITEGESDCWHVENIIGLTDRPIEVLALPSGAGSWKDSWLRDLDQFDRVVIVMDNDRAGEQARDKLRSRIGWLKVEDAYVPQLFNDVREAVLAGWDGDSLRRSV